jgi:ATP-binding cassette subfamily B multidrug efflux pump
LFNKLIARFFKLYTTNNRPVMFLAIGSAVFQSLLLLPSVYFIKLIFDVDIPSKDISGLVRHALPIIGVTIFQSILAMVHRNAFLKVVKGAIKALQQDVLKRLVYAERRFYDDTDVAKIINNSVTDIDLVDKMMDSLLSTLVPQSTLFVIGVLIMMVYNPLVGVSTVVLGIAGAVIQRVMRKNIYKKIYSYNQARDSLTAYVQFLPEKQILTKMRNAEQTESGFATDLSDKLISEGTAAAKNGWSIRVTDDLVVNISATLLIVIGSLQILSGTSTYGNIFGLYFLIMFIKRTVTSIQSNRAVVYEGTVSLERVFKLLDTVESYPQINKQRTDISFSGNISAEAISFAYSARPILNGVDFKISKGEIVCLTGANGTGKSSLINLLLGFYAPLTGAITADDRPYTSLNISQLRSSIGYVPQSQVLISGTIESNLLYGLSETSTIEASLESTPLFTQLMQGFPEGLNTPVVDGGKNLSNGQVQRISILRALVTKPALLILDEPTNHLDGGSIIALIEEIRKQLTMSVLIISHHTLFQQVADKTYLLENGKLSLL